MQRNIEVDTIRTAALIGICVVNVPFLGTPLSAMLDPPTGALDCAAAFAVEALFQGKFFLLFSFLFGWGLHIQDAAAARSGASFRGRYFRRLAGLGLIGAAHAILVFVGDILVLYALMGAVVWPLRRFSPEALARFSLAMIPVAAAGLVLLALALETIPVDPPSTAGLGGSFTEATATRLRDWPDTFVFILLFNGPLTLAAFALGIAAAKVDFFVPGSPHFKRIASALPDLATLGVALNLFYAASIGGLAPMEGNLVAALATASLAIGAPVLSAVYLVGLVHLARRLRPGPGWTATGRNSLSGYVADGVIAGFVFGGYGLGLYGDLGQAALLALAVAIAGAGIAVASFARGPTRGPLEIVLRFMTRGPDRRTAPRAP